MDDLSNVVIDALAATLVETRKWPLEYARKAARSFISMQVKYIEEFQRYEKLPRQEQIDLWIYYASGWNQGRLFSALPTN